ncbi:MAG: SET domain-containing protein [Candidatus Hydrogenedentes bacterium]|nr:SET domain-containing protein [Candidatus Hydrogenedentota bacterium]
MRKRKILERAPTDRYPFAIRKSRIHGVGVFTRAPLPARRKVGELTGPLLPVRDARRLVRDRARIYLVEVDDRWALDCSGGSALGHINHCCRPNCYLRIVNRRVELYTLRRIAAGAELTIDYGQTPHANGMACGCGRPNCKGRL